MTPLRSSIVVLLVLGLTGCGLIGSRKETALNATLSQYHTAMRWGHWDSLMSIRAPKAPAVADLERDNIRVTSYEVRQPPVSVGEDEVRQVVEIEYVLTDRQRVHSLLDDQQWRYDPERKQWLLHSPFPTFH